MGMNTYVVGIKPPDEKWKKMKAIYEACNNAKIELPDEVEKYFDGEAPDDSGVLVEQEALGKAVTEYQEDSREGYEVDITKLPKNVKIIRFINSY